MSDNNKLVISVLGLEKFFAPTMEYAGEQLLELVKYLVERAKKRLYKEEKDDYFHGIPGRNIPLILENIEGTYGLPVESIRSANPYDTFPKWHWPFHNQNGSNYIDNILCKIERKVDRNEFLNALCQSLSLDQAEKQRVINAWPTLSQFQIDELLKVFSEEKKKFEKELFIEHPRDIWSLVYKQQLEWAVIVLKDRRIGLESFLIPPLNGKFLFPYFALWAEYWQKNGAMLMDEVKDYRSASKALQQACYLSPENPYCWIRLGYCYVRLKYFDFALNCFYKVRNIKPDNNIVLLDICELHILKNDFEVASNILNEVTAKLPNEYQHILLALEFLIKIFKENEWKDPEGDLKEFISNMGNESPYNWVDLKEFVLASASLEQKVQKKTVRFLQMLIALSV